MLKKLTKKLFNRQNVLFSAGLILLLLGVIVWVVNFSFVKPEVAKAAAGDFSETWMADEIYGTYRMGDDPGEMMDNTWGAVVGERFCSNSDTMPALSNVVGTTGKRWLPNARCNYWTKIGDQSGSIKQSYLDARDPIQVTKWTVTGNITP